MYGLQEHEMRFYCLFKKVYFSLLATSDFFCRHAYAYAHMRIIRHESDMAAYAWPSLVCIPGRSPTGFKCTQIVEILMDISYCSCRRCHLTIENGRLFIHCIARRADQHKKFSLV